MSIKEEHNLLHSINLFFLIIVVTMPPKNKRNTHILLPYKLNIEQHIYRLYPADTEQCWHLLGVSISPVFSL